MLNMLAARGLAAGDAAQHRAIVDGVARVQAAFPELVVSGVDDAIVLTGRIAPDDPRLRWIGSLLR